jgi:hypothetical protein
MNEGFLFIYFLSLLWIVLGGAIGWAVTKRIIGIFIFNLGFALIGFLIFPGLWGLV